MSEKVMHEQRTNLVLIHFSWANLFDIQSTSSINWTPLGLGPCMAEAGHVDCVHPDLLARIISPSPFHSHYYINKKSYEHTDIQVFLRTESNSSFYPGYFNILYILSKKSLLHHCSIQGEQLTACSSPLVLKVNLCGFFRSSMWYRYLPVERIPKAAATLSNKNRAPGNIFNIFRNTLLNIALGYPHSS